MGADDGGSNYPHPAAQNQPVPRDDQGPRHVPWDNLFPDRPTRIAARQHQQQQVSEPASYAVASKILLASAGALAGALLALVALHVYYTARRARLRGGGGGGRLRLDRSLAVAGAGEPNDGGAAGPSRRGLDPAVLGAMPVAAAGAGAGDCVVCLAELEPGDKARALPRCGHVFHVECIDAWFRGNATCPLCRADVVALDAAAAVEPQPEVRIDVVAGVDTMAAAKAAMAPAMGRLASGTALDKTRRCKSV